MNLAGIPSDWVLIVPSDTVQINYVGLLVTVTGDLVWKPQTNSTAVTLPAAAVGTIIPGQVSVVTTGTTATVYGAKA
jgi:hypothetical protein